MPVIKSGKEKFGELDSQAAIASQIANQTMFISNPNSGVVTPTVNTGSKAPISFIVILGFAGVAYYVGKYYGWVGLFSVLGIGVYALKKVNA